MSELSDLILKDFVKKHPKLTNIAGYSTSALWTATWLAGGPVLLNHSLENYPDHTELMLPAYLLGWVASLFVGSKLLEETLKKVIPMTYVTIYGKKKIL